MSNSFDFELVADDKVSGAIERINESLNDLQPKLDKTRTGLQFGGQETLDGNSSIRLKNKLPAGVYFLQITDRSGHMQTLRVIRQ